ncbi:hypothetical protein LAZ67_8002552 [Cordylochernes scorpioides]|uniref:Gag protein n=1 Tax=Cordylochernes scorpioides TaxID=51811 RepID=A0ABY6KUQ5_9ARAC|nr:hypothetical protein LAZ67_8002552 [Cordylochernes scorpioides]
MKSNDERKNKSVQGWEKYVQGSLVDMASARLAEFCSQDLLPPQLASIQASHPSRRCFPDLSSFLPPAMTPPLPDPRIPCHHDFEAQSFFDNFDAQADRAELTYTDRLRKLPCYLQAPSRQGLHPTYHNPPPRHNNQRSSRVTYQVAPPPSPCKYCNAMHWHSQCEQRFQQNRTSQVYNARPRTTTVPKSGTRPKVQSRNPVPQVQAASRDDSTSPASNSTHVWIGVSFDKQWRPHKPLVPPSCNMCKTP